MASFRIGKNGATWNKEENILILSRHLTNGFPAMVTIIGKNEIVDFYYDYESAKKYEYWDGELAQYVSDSPNVFSGKLVII